eukprot:PITA_01182
MVGIKPTRFTFARVLSACIGLSYLEQGRQFHGTAIHSGFELNVFLGNALMDMCVNCSSIEDSRELINKMPERNEVSRNVMVTGYFLQACEQGKQLHALVIRADVESNSIMRDSLIDMYAKYVSIEDAYQMFDKMPNRNLISWTAIITGYLQVRYALEKRQDIHGYVVRNGCQLEGLVGSALVGLLMARSVIVMYAKCGSLENAPYVFYKISEKDAASWNAMLAGYAMHGLYDQLQGLSLIVANVGVVVVKFDGLRASVADGWHQSQPSLNFYDDGATPVD